KLQPWTQGPVMLQTLNILENFNLKEMGYNSTRYIHTLYQAMNLAFADRDFYYGDPAFPPEEPMTGLLSKEYAKERSKLIKHDRTDPAIWPGDTCPCDGYVYSVVSLLDPRHAVARLIYPSNDTDPYRGSLGSFYSRTTSTVAPNRVGWVLSIS